MVRGYLFRLSLGFGSRRSLAARGQFLNTFAGLGFWVAFSLLALGGYLIEQQFENPIQAQSAGLLLAAPLITTATTLFYLLYSSRKLRRHVPVWPVSRFLGREDKRCQTQYRGADRRRGQLAVARPLHRPRRHSHTALATITLAESPGSSAPPK